MERYKADRPRFEVAESNWHPREYEVWRLDGKIKGGTVTSDGQKFTTRAAAEREAKRLRKQRDAIN